MVLICKKKTKKFPSPKDAIIVPSLVEIFPVVLHGEQDENVKSLQTDRWMDR